MPSQPAAISAAAEAAPDGLAGAPLESLWRQAEAERYGLGWAEFGAILLAIGARHNYGQPAGAAAPAEVRWRYLSGLRVADLALARGCAAGNEVAWERFFALYRQPLTRAGMAIAGSDSVGRDLADALYGELYGTGERDGRRRSPLDSYQGRGSLLGWLRTILAQRYVDHHRKTWREEPLPEAEGESPAADAPAADCAANAEQVTLLGAAIEHCLADRNPEDRFLLAAYYLDQRTLAQIARAVAVHEATVSRRLRRAVDELRGDLLRELQRRGLSLRAAQEALGADPRDVTGIGDLDARFKALLQYSQTGAFPEKAGP